MGLPKNKRLAIGFTCSAWTLRVEQNALIQIVVFIIADVFLTFLDFLWIRKKINEPGAKDYYRHSDQNEFNSFFVWNGS